MTHMVTDTTRKTVIIARGCKMTLGDIAKAIDINTDTLNKYYKDELEVGLAKFKLKVGDALLKEIEKGNATLIKYYMNNMMEFTEKAQLDVNNHTLEITPVPEFNKILERLAAEKATINGTVISEDRPLLPAPICAEQT